MPTEVEASNAYNLLCGDTLYAERSRCSCKAKEFYLLNKDLETDIVLYFSQFLLPVDFVDHFHVKMGLEDMEWEVDL